MEPGYRLPFVTVLVPCRNEADFIERCLTSILSNGYPADRLGVLVVDGRSEDGTRSVLGAYAQRHACVRVIDNPGRTTPKALNLGVREAQEDVVLRVDAHARLERGYIRRCVEALYEHHADVACGLMRTVPAVDSPVGQAIAAALSHPFGVGNSYFRIHVSDATWVDTVFCGCYRREVFARVPAPEGSRASGVMPLAPASIDRQGPFNVDLIRGQDMDFSLRLRKTGGRMLLVPDVASEYYARSTISAFWRQNWNNGLWAMLPFAYTDGVPVSLRHLIPLFFVTALLATAAVGVVSRPWCWVSGVIPAVYGMVNVAASVHVAWTSKSFSRLILMPFVFAALHLGYGLGSLWGLVRLISLPRFWRKLRLAGAGGASAVEL